MTVTLPDRNGYVKKDLEFRTLYNAIIHLQRVLGHEHKLHSVLLSQLLLDVVVPAMPLRKLLSLLQLLPADLVTVCSVRSVSQAGPAGVCPEFLY